MTDYTRQAISARLAAAQQERAIRAEKQSCARAKYRSTGIHANELIAALQSIHAALTCKSSWQAEKLMELITEIDDEENAPPPEPELLQYRSEHPEFNAYPKTTRLS